MFAWAFYFPNHQPFITVLALILGAVAVFFFENSQTIQVKRGVARRTRVAKNRDLVMSLAKVYIGNFLFYKAWEAENLVEKWVRFTYNEIIRPGGLVKGKGS